MPNCSSAARNGFDEAFTEQGAFTSKTTNGRRYWYFQTRVGEKRTQRYVGPETPELLERIAHHGKDAIRTRASLPRVHACAIIHLPRS